MVRERLAHVCLKVDIIGGGPAGLYFSVLVKKSLPQAEVTVTERNHADDTFGFGIVYH
jgi:anthraniloyl-CoA monooxygenase